MTDAEKREAAHQFIKCSMELLEEKTFFPEALKMLGKKLSFVTKVSMKVAEKKKQVIILRLKLN